MINWKHVTFVTFQQQTSCSIDNRNSRGFPYLSNGFSIKILYGILFMLCMALDIIQQIWSNIWVSTSAYFALTDKILLIFSEVQNNGFLCLLSILLPLASCVRNCCFSTLFFIAPDWCFNSSFVMFYFINYGGFFLSFSRNLEINLLMIYSKK